MATFSLGTSGVAPGAPGVYINEQAGKLANAAIADFSSVYMLVETEEGVPVTKFPFNVPVKISSLNDYKELIRVGTTTVPENRIPLLSYNCVNEFFQNSQVGDLRVVRVGTPNQVVEIEFFPTGSKINSAGLPSALQAGDKVYVQMVINGQKLVSGDGSTGYTSGGEWLGVPVTMPVNYVSGDQANNRKISAAITAAVAAAISTNPAVSASVYVRDSGLVSDLLPTSNSENGYVTISATTFDANVTVVTITEPVGSNYVFMQNLYDVQNIVGQQNNLQRVPQDYTQCIDTAFDGIQDQGYLITPTAYAQFDAEGRALVGAAAAAHCENNNFKWLALADPGPYLVTDINKYDTYTPHAAAADLYTGMKYLVDNAIYEWIGTDVTYGRLNYQSIVYGESAKSAVNEAANLVAADTKVGLLDLATYTVNAVATSVDGVFQLDTTQWWPVTLPVQQVALTNAGGDFNSVDIQGGATGVNLEGTEVFIIAPPYDTVNDSEYSLNYVFMATNATDAVAVYNSVVAAGGSVNITAPPTGAIFVPAPTGDTAQVRYADPYWDFPVSINGQTSDLIQNTSGASAGVNTLHLPGTLQKSTTDYTLSWVNRTILNPSTQVTSYVGSAPYNGAAAFGALLHRLVDGQKLFFTQSITVTSGTTTTNLVSATTKLVSTPYWVKVINANTFVLASSLANYTNSSYIQFPSTGTLNTAPTVFYTQVLGRAGTAVNSVELTTLPMIRARKYGFDTNTIFNVAANAALAPATGTNMPGSSIFLNNSSIVLGKDQINPYGEDLTSATLCDYLPEFNLTAPTSTPTVGVYNAFCSPTVDQFFQSEFYFVPSIDSILVGTYDGATAGTLGPAATLGISTATTTAAAGVYNSVVTTSVGAGTGATATITVVAGNITAVSLNSPGQGYAAAEVLNLPASFGGAQLNVATLNTANGSIASAVASGYGSQLGIAAGDTAAQMAYDKAVLAGCYFDVVGAGTAPDGTAVIVGDRLALTYNGSSYSWVVVPAATSGGDLTTVGTPCYGSQVEIALQPEEGVSSTLWNFDAITSTEIISDALRGVGFGGVPQAAFIEAGIDNVNRLYDDSQRYFNPFGFIAYYGPYVENGAGQWIPPSPYVTGVAVRRYRAEGYQFPPAGVKYQLADALGAQISVNSAQQNLLNPDGCNVIRTLPGYPTTSVFIWGGRTRVNAADAQQRLYQFINTRVILNVVYGSLRSAFDSQIFNVIDGFGVVFNQIVSVGNSVLNQLYVKGALFGARPSDAFQVICDGRINSSEDLENGIVNAKIFVTPVPTLERIQIDLIRVALGKMSQELDIQGLGSNNQ